MSAGVLNIKLFTVEEYYKMGEIGILNSDDRFELIHGQIIKMSPVKSLHSSITDDLFGMLYSILNKKVIVKSQNPIRLSNLSEPQPDLTIAHYKKHKYRQKHPQSKDIYWLIEVSDSTLQKDKTIKKELYAKAGIPEYWIVNIPEKCIAVYRNLEEEQYQEVIIFNKGEKVTFEKLGFTLSVDDIF